jgi:predicted component of type VI protein secretion system
MLPYTHEITGNWPLTEQWIRLFTGLEVRVTENATPVYELPESLQKRMGSAVLGQDLVLGGQFSDGISAVEIRFEDLEINELIELLPGGQKRTFLEELFVQFLLPAEVPFTIKLACKEVEETFALTEDNEANILGYTLHI